MRRRGTVSTLRALAATALASLGASAQQTTPPVASIDIYGSSVLDSAAARAEFGADLLRKANNHDPASDILTAVSGETFGDRDYAAWERWTASR